MKRLYSFLSLLLMFFVGATTVSAQEFSKGTLLTTTAEVAAQSRVLVYSPGTSGDHPSGYLCGTSKYLSAPGQDCLFVIEAVGRQSEDGYDLYRLKQNSTGLYFKDLDLHDFWDSSDMPGDYFTSGDLTDMTADPALAAEFTVLPFTDGTGVAGNTRTSAINAKQDLTEVGFVFTRGQLATVGEETASAPYQYLGGLGRPFWSKYTDTNVYKIYTVNELKGYDKVIAYLQFYLPGGSSTYPAGTDPGFYDPAAVQVLKDLERESAVFAEEGVSDEEADQWCARLVAAVEVVKKSLKTIETGYYFIKDSRETPRYWRTISHQNQTALGWATYTVPETLNAESGNFIWHVTKTTVKNEQTGANEVVYTLQQHFSEMFVVEKKVGEFFGMSETPDKFVITTEGALSDHKGSFIIYPYGKSGQKMNTFNNGGIGVWNWVDAGNCFSFKTITQEEVDGIAEAARQAALNDKLQTIYSKSVEMKKLNDGGIGIVTSASALSCNFPDPQEGRNIGDLIDNNVGTYFHTSWRNNEAEQGKYHYVQADLGYAVDKITLDYTRRWRTSTTSNHTPLTAIVEVTNNPEGEWTMLPDFTFEYNKAIDYPASVAGKDTTLVDGGGESTIEFGAQYRYIRISVTSVLINEKSAEHNHFTYPFWYLSELHFCNNDITPNYYQVDETVRTTFETLLAQAEAELADSAATQATIDGLKAAYDAVLNAMPVPSRITEAVAKAKEVAAKLAVGNEIGYVSKAALDEFNAVMAAAEASILPGMTLEDIEAQIAAVEAAAVALQAAIKMPEVGQYYLIRSRSTKKSGSTTYNSLRALLGSEGNAVTGALRFIKPEGSEQLEDGSFNPAEALNDTIDTQNDIRYFWLVESVNNGKIVLRNGATGMYLSNEQTENNGHVYQSVAPVELNIEIAAPGAFTFESGKGLYFNCQGGGAVVCWNEKADENGFWSFEAIDNPAEYPTYNLKLRNGLQIVTLPVPINVYEGGFDMYALAGQDADGQLVLTPFANLADYIPAGVPFIINVVDAFNTSNYNVQLYYVTEEEDFESTISNGTMVYALEPATFEGQEGLVGTLSEKALATPGMAYFTSAGELAGVSPQSHVEIGSNSGYFNGTQIVGVEAADGDLTLSLPKNFVLNSIDDAVVIKNATNNVYNAAGVLVRKNVKANEALKNLPAGVYIIGSQKVVVK